MFRIAHMFRDRGMFAPGGGAPFGVANLQADPNCVLAQLPDYGVWGLQDFPPGTYTETQRYQWAAAKQVPWLRRNRFLNTATLSTQTVSSVTAVPITVSFKGTGTITFSTAYSGSLVGTGANDRVTATFTPSAGNLVCTVSGTVTEAQCENASAATEYQPIGASWDATYAALAAAAGFNTGIWQDAGTNPVNTSGQSVYRIADASGKGYVANQATAANRPLWTLDPNGKPYLLGDNVNDAMPVTLPNLGSNCVEYVVDEYYTLKSSGLTINGSYAPLTRPKEYGRILFKNGTPAYEAKLLRWLNAKRGFEYQLGPELVVNGGFDSDTIWVKSGATTISGGTGNLIAINDKLRQINLVVAGKMYYVEFTVSGFSGTSIAVNLDSAGNNTAQYSITANGRRSIVLTALGTALNFFAASATGSIDNVSVREILVP